MSAPLLKTPLHALHLELGAKMVEFAGYDMPVSYPAGISRMHLGRFMLYSTLGSLVWNFALIYAGFLLGENYEEIEAALKPYENVIYVIVLVVLGILVARWIIGKRRGRAEPA